MVDNDKYHRHKDKMLESKVVKVTSGFGIRENFMEVRDMAWEIF